jgi:CubicO group peptidase (beta-lactamase class C family)
MNATGRGRTMKTDKRLSLAIGAVAVLALAAPLALWAQPRPGTVLEAPQSPDPATSPPSLTKQDADAWLDGFMPYALETGDVAGAVIVIVKDGQVLTERGFGYADVAAKTPVDPVNTLFRPGSTSKLFTWTAVMQQVELGRIDLDADVNTYLDFKIPPYQGKPVTMREIMTHTAGFEEALEGLMIMGGTSSPPLDQVVKHWTPRRAFPAGTTPAYSNYATVLAGYIVQRVSGEPYDDYIERHIFKPLEMNHSSFRQPLPASLAPMMSKGYQLGSGPAKPYEIITFRPAGSGSMTGDDMSKFMIAHLNEANNPLLKPATAHKMHTTALTVFPTLNRMELGFMETNHNGYEIIGHGGDTRWFHSDLWLIPEKNVGVFFSMNSAGKGAANLTIREGLLSAFMNRYYPAPKQAASNFKPNPDDAKAMVGTYSASRRSESGLRRALNFFSQFTVKTDPNGELQIPGFEFASLSGSPRHWVEVAPLVWKDRNSDERLAGEEKNGKVTRFSVDSFSPFTVYTRVPWYESTAWLRPGAMLSLGALLILTLSAPIGFIARKYYAGERRLTGGEWTSYVASVVLALGVMGLLFFWFNTLTTLLFQALGTGTYLLEVATILLFPALCVATAWFFGAGVSAKRAWYSLTLRALPLLAALCLLWCAVAFNLTHIGLNY